MGHTPNADDGDINKASLALTLARAAAEKCTTQSQHSQTHTHTQHQAEKTDSNRRLSGSAMQATRSARPALPAVVAYQPLVQTCGALQRAGKGGG